MSAPANGSRLVKWIDHRLPMLVDDIVAEFGLDKDKTAKIKRYAQRKPVMQGQDSALAIRDRVRAGKSIRGFLPEAVASYIERRGLYRESLRC